GELLGNRLGHADQRGLGGDVVRLPRVAGDADHGRDRDDPTEPRLHHWPRRRSHQPERGFEVDADDVLELLVLHPHEQIVAGDARIVDQDVELAAERLYGRGYELVDRRPIGEIARKRDVIAAEAPAERLQLVYIAARDGQARALPGQCPRNGAAEPAAGAGNEGGHARE